MTTDEALREHTRALLAVTAAREYLHRTGRLDRPDIRRRVDLGTVWRRTLTARQTLRFFGSLPGRSRPVRGRR